MVEQRRVAHILSLARAAGGLISISNVAALVGQFRVHCGLVMKNITVSVDDEVLAAVRRYAAERNSSVNALVREYLTSLAAREDRARRARARLRQLSNRSQGRLGKKTWSRGDLHGRLGTV
jgi:hypothetical protein